MLFCNGSWGAYGDERVIRNGESEYMRGVVVGTKNGQAAVWEKGGGMRYIPDAGYQKGQLLELPEVTDIPAFGLGKIAGSQIGMPLKNGIGAGSKAGRFVIRYGAGIAAAAAIAIIGGGITAAAATSTASTVTLNTSPALEYRMNYFDRVIGVSSSDGSSDQMDESVLRDIRGKRIDDAIEISFEALDTRVELPENADDISVTVESTFKGKRKKLKTRAEDELRDRHDRFMHNRENIAEPENDGNIGIPNEDPSVSNSDQTHDELNSDGRKDFGSNPDGNTNNDQIGQDNTPGKNDQRGQNPSEKGNNPTQPNSGDKRNSQPNGKSEGQPQLPAQSEPGDAATNDPGQNKAGNEQQPGSSKSGQPTGPANGQDGNGMNGNIDHGSSENNGVAPPPMEQPSMEQAPPVQTGGSNVSDAPPDQPPAGQPAPSDEGYGQEPPDHQPSDQQPDGRDMYAPSGQPDSGRGDAPGGNPSEPIQN